jgi:hypothetical protein
MTLFLCYFYSEERCLVKYCIAIWWRWTKNFWIVPWLFFEWEHSQCGVGHITV